MPDSTVSLENKKVTITLPKKEEGKKRLAKLQEEECRTVKGRFIFHECPGGTSHIVCKKFKDVPEFNKVMQDNQEYEIPLWVARWLNGYDRMAEDLGGLVNSCAYPVHKYAQDPQGAARIDVGQWRRRYSFQSMDFLGQ